MFCRGSTIIRSLGDRECATLVDHNRFDMYAVRLDDVIFRPGTRNIE